MILMQILGEYHNPSFNKIKVLHLGQTGCRSSVSFINTAQHAQKVEKSMRVIALPSLPAQQTPIQLIETKTCLTLSQTVGFTERRRGGGAIREVKKSSYCWGSKHWIRRRINRRTVVHWIGYFGYTVAKSSDEQPNLGYH